MVVGYRSARGKDRLELVRHFRRMVEARTTYSVGFAGSIRGHARAISSPRLGPDWRSSNVVPDSAGVGSRLHCGGSGMDGLHLGRLLQTGGPDWRLDVCRCPALEGRASPRLVVEGRSASGEQFACGPARAYGSRARERRPVSRADSRRRAPDRRTWNSGPVAGETVNAAGGGRNS